MKNFWSIIFLFMAFALCAVQAYVFRQTVFPGWQGLLLTLLTLACIIGSRVMVGEGVTKIVEGLSAFFFLGLVSLIAWSMFAAGGYTGGWDYSLMTVQSLAFLLYSLGSSLADL